MHGRSGTPRGLSLAVGVLTLGAGLVPTLAALDVIPTPDAAFGAPRWIVLLIVQPFLLIGLGITLHGLGMPARVFRARGLAGGRVFVAGGSLLWSWIVLYGNTGDGATIAVGPVAIPVPSFIARPVNRAMVAGAALLTIAIAAALWFSAVRTSLAARRGEATARLGPADEETTR